MRDHATVGWGSAVTVITEEWYLNCKVDGAGAFLYDLSASEPYARNVADEHADVVQRLYAMAAADAEAGGGFPDYIRELARNQMDAPGCSALAARPV